MIHLKLKEQASLPLQASKWLKLPVLLDTEEMQAFLLHLEPFLIVRVSGVIEAGNELLEHQTFLEAYKNYVDHLKNGHVLQDPYLRSCFSSVFTLTTDALYAVDLGLNRRLVKVEHPVIQLQAHTCDYSAIEDKIRSMVFGINSISWGIQFSYPQLYQDENCQIQVVKPGPEFPNTVLFQKMQRWIRQHTIPTPFLTPYQRINAPIRMGRQVLNWINNHPQLKAKNLSIKTS